MSLIHDLNGNVSSAIDDIVARYNELRRLEMVGRLDDARRQELQAIRHQLHFDD